MNMIHRWPFLFSAFASVFISSCSANTEDSTDTPKAPPEVGAVEWRTDYPAALAEAKRDNKPIFALFQEVPG